MTVLLDLGDRWMRRLYTMKVSREYYSAYLGKIGFMQ